MNRMKLVALLLLFMMVISPLAQAYASGAGTAPANETESSSEPDSSTEAESMIKADWITVEPLMQYIPSITSVGGTNYLIISTQSGDKQAVFNTALEQISQYQYAKMAYLDYGLFQAWDDEEINHRAIVTPEGAQLTDFAYGAFSAYSRNWAIGYVLSPGTKEDYQYKSGKKYYHIDRYDVFYFGDEDKVTQPVASLQYEDFSKASAHGDFLAIIDRNDKITLYDQTFAAQDMEMKKISSPVYGFKNYAALNLATGEIIRDGVSAAKELLAPSGAMLAVAYKDYSGRQLAGIITTKGEEVLPFEVEGTISAMNGDYLVFSSASKMVGLYSMKEHKIVVPCEFNNIMVSKVSSDPYVFRGYVAVENGDQRGYYDTKTGRISCEIKYNRKEVTTIGCSTFWKAADGEWIIAAADGAETKVKVDEIYAKTRGDGYLLVAVKDGLYGVIDWHGNEVLPFIHNKVITVTDDSTALLRTSTGVELDRIVIAE